MSKPTRTAAALLACALVLPLGACAGKKPTADTEYVARDVNPLALPKAGWTRPLRGIGQAFDEVERSTPIGMGPPRPLMSAFSTIGAQNPEAVSRRAAS